MDLAFSECKAKKTELGKVRAVETAKRTLGAAEKVDKFWKERVLRLLELKTLLARQKSDEDYIIVKVNGTYSSYWSGEESQAV